MQPGAITNYIDVAQLVLYAFWIFFAGLIYYLHREGKREGYPLLTERKGVTLQGFPFVPAPKTFLLANGHVVHAPRPEAPEVLNAVPSARFPGAPYQPIGNPMLSGMGPGAWARRADHPDLAFDDQMPKIVPLRSATAFFLDHDDPSLMGYEVFGLDGVHAGKIVDVWVDRSEYMVRYLEIALAHPADATHVLMPIHYTEIDRKRQTIGTNFITGAQFATVPATRSPDTVTLLEEDKIMAYYAGGKMYAVPGRGDPLI